MQERNCVAGPHSGAVDSNQTWCIEDTPHRVTGEVTIAAGVSLTIEAGVEVRFSGVGLTVNGSLFAVGTEAQPIRFTSDLPTPAPDDWTRLAINSGAAARLDYCTLEYAGAGTAQSALELAASDVVIDHCTIQHNAGSTAAVRLLSVGMTPTLRNTHILDNSGYAIYQTHVDMAPTVQNLTFSGNTHNAFYIQQGYLASLTRPAVWDGGQLNGSPYIAEYVTVSPTGQLTLGAGTTLRLTPNAILQVQGGGQLYANGQPGQPVTITSVDSSSYIGRIQLHTDSHARLSYCDLSRVRSGESFALNIYSSDVIVEHCNIHDNFSSQGALRFGGQGITPILRHTAIYNNVGYAIVHNPPDMAPSHVDLTLSGNGVDAVYITGGGTFDSALQRPVVWDGAQLHGSPFIADRVTVAASGWLTLTAVQEAVLALAVPSNAQFVSGTGGAIEWPQRHQVYWRLGDLDPGESGSLAVRIRYRWGIPDRTIDAAQAMLVGVNYPHPPLVVDDYLDYQPRVALSQTPLTQAQFDAERAAAQPELVHGGHLHRAERPGRQRPGGSLPLVVPHGGPVPVLLPAAGLPALTEAAHTRRAQQPETRTVLPPSGFCSLTAARLKAYSALPNSFSISKMTSSETP